MKVLAESFAKKLFVDEMVSCDMNEEWAVKAWADMTFPADDWADEAFEYFWKAQEALSSGSVSVKDIVLHVINENSEQGKNGLSFTEVAELANCTEADVFRAVNELRFQRKINIYMNKCYRV